MNTYEVNGTYGSNKTPCIVFVDECLHGLKWYAVEDSYNVNATYDDIRDGVDVETLQDVDTFTASLPIDSPETLETELDS